MLPGHILAWGHNPTVNTNINFLKNDFHCGQMSVNKNKKRVTTNILSYSVVGIVTGYGLDDWGVKVQVPVGSRMFSTSSRPVLRPAQYPIQWVPGALSPEIKRPGVKLTTHLQLMSRSRKCGSIHPLPHTPSWHSA
jgi:hypothetical protein